MMPEAEKNLGSKPYTVGALSRAAMSTLKEVERRLEKAEEVIKKMRITSDKLAEESRQRDTQHRLITICADVSIRKVDEKIQNAKEKLEEVISTAKERMDEVIKQKRNPISKAEK